MPKLTFEEVLERLAEERQVRREEVCSRDLSRVVWISGSGSPGCLYDNGPNVHYCKADAINYCAAIADWYDDSPNPYRGIVSSLRNYHSFTAETGEHFEISKHTLGEIL